MVLLCNPLCYLCFVRKHVHMGSHTYTRKLIITHRYAHTHALLFHQVVTRNETYHITWSSITLPSHVSIGDKKPQRQKRFIFNWTCIVETHMYSIQRHTDTQLQRRLRRPIDVFVFWLAGTGVTRRFITTRIGLKFAWLNLTALQPRHVLVSLNRRDSG